LADALATDENMMMQMARKRDLHAVQATLPPSSSNLG
jgi:hypothetical protein